MSKKSGNTDRPIVSGEFAPADVHIHRGADGSGYVRIRHKDERMTSEFANGDLRFTFENPEQVGGAIRWRLNIDFTADTWHVPVSGWEQEDPLGDEMRDEIRKLYTE